MFIDRNSGCIWMLAVLGLVAMCGSGCSEKQSKESDVAPPEPQFRPWGVSPEDAAAWQEDHIAIKRSVLSTVPVVQQFNQLYPGATGNGHATDGSPGKFTIVNWRSVTSLYQRYALRLDVRCYLDETHRNVKSTDPPTFLLIEISSVELDENGRPWKGRYGRVQEHFGMDTWEKLRAADGRIEEVFPNIKTDAPVPNFVNDLE